MIKTIKSSLAYLVLLGFLVSCGSDTLDPAPTSGTISGSVLLFDEGSTRQEDAGMKVTVENSSPAISAVTDATGKFQISNVPFGNHVLVYEKTGYGTFKKKVTDHKAASTPITDTPSLGKVSTTTITAVELGITGGNLVTAVTTSPAGNSGNRRYIRYFFSDTPDVSNTNYKGFSPTYIVQDAPYSKTFTAAELTGFGVSATGTLHVRVYGDSFFTNDYVDPVSNKRVFPNLNATTVASKSVTF